MAPGTWGRPATMDRRGPFPLRSAMMVPRGKYPGAVSAILRSTRPSISLGDPACNGWIDCRDLGQVFEHEGLLPHPAQDQPQ